MGSEMCIRDRPDAPRLQLLRGRGAVSSLSASLLSAHGCIVLDCGGADVFVWAGSGACGYTRWAATRLARALLRARGLRGAQPNREPSGYESVIFQSKWDGWAWPAPRVLLGAPPAVASGAWVRAAAPGAAPSGGAACDESQRLHADVHTMAAALAALVLSLIHI